MPVIRKVVSRSDGFRTKVDLETWSGLACGDEGESSEAFPDSVQISGTFGGRGTLVIEGSNDGVTYHVLNDPDGSPVQIRAPGIVTIAERPRFYRPRVPAGDSSTTLTVVSLIRRP